MTLSTREFPIEIVRGDSDVHQIVVKNTDETIKDITGAAVRYTIREFAYDGMQVYQKTVGDGIILTDAINGVLQRTLTYAEVAALNPGIRYVYDCELTIGAERKTVQTGQITVIGDVSV